MQAIRVASAGGPEVLEWAETEVPEPGPGQVLVRVVAAGVNFIDTYQRGGLYPMDLPFTPGLEGAGFVESRASDVTDLEIGARVAWPATLGSYAQFAAVPADRLVPVPDAVDLDLAAATMLQGMTAHYLALSTFPLEAGQSCLIHAGAGGVGQLLIQIAKRQGAKVFATVGTAEKAELARAAGADHVIIYTEHDFQVEIERIAGPKAIDVVYDGVGADTVGAGMELLRPRGMMVTFGNASGPPPDVSAFQLMRLGSLLYTRPSLKDYIATRSELEERAFDLFRWIEDGQLNVSIGARFPLADAAEAHRALEGRKTTGKVLLDV